jgi:hypothetical protein
VAKLLTMALDKVVGYPIINLSPEREDVHRYVRDLEEVLIRTMSDFGIESFRIEGLTGCTHFTRKDCCDRRSHSALGYDPWLCPECKHRLELL